MEIKFNGSVYGSLFNKLGDTILISTQNGPYIQDSFSRINLQEQNEAFFFVCMDVDKRGNSIQNIVHIQCQYTKISGRLYDMRVFYNLDMKSIVTSGVKIGKIVNSLPRLMKQYEQPNIGSLKDSFKLQDISEVTQEKVDALCYYIVKAITEGKRLFISLDVSDGGWFENEVFNNEVAKTIFAAIDNLPEQLRPAISFALSVNEKLSNDILNKFLIVLYHGAIPAVSDAVLNIKWSDVNSKNGDEYIKMSKEIDLNLQVFLNGSENLYAKKCSSMAAIIKLRKIMAITEKGLNNVVMPEEIEIATRYLKIKNSHEANKILLKTDKITNEDKLALIKEMNQEVAAKLEKEIVAVLDQAIEDKVINAMNIGDGLQDIVTFFDKKIEKEDIYTRYLEKYVRYNLKSQSEDELICTIENILNFSFKIKKKDVVKAMLEDSITQSVINKLSKDEVYIKLLKLVAENKIKFTNVIKESIRQKELYFFSKLLKEKLFKDDFVCQCLKETGEYCTNDKKIVSPQFIQLFKKKDEEKLKELRAHYLNSYSLYPLLFNDVTKDDIKKINIEKKDAALYSLISANNAKNKNFVGFIVNKYPLWLGFVLGVILMLIPIFTVFDIKNNDTESHIEYSQPADNFNKNAGNSDSSNASVNTNTSVRQNSGDSANAYKDSNQFNSNSHN